MSNRLGNMPIIVNPDADAYTFISPTPMRYRGTRFAVGCIYCMEVLNGFAFFLLAPNVAEFGRDQLGFLQSTSVIISIVFSGVVYSTPIIGGLLGDAVFGRYKTICAGNVLFLLGMAILLILTVVLKTTEVQINFSGRMALFCISLIFVATGQGFITANITPFGAYQVDNGNGLRLKRFFRWCMFFFNIGKLAAYLPIPFLMKGATYKLADLTLPVVQVIVAILAAVVFGVGKKAYKRPPIAGRQNLSHLLRGFRHMRYGKKSFLPSDAPYKEVRRWYAAHLLRMVFFLFAMFATTGVFEAIYFQLETSFPMEANYFKDPKWNIPPKFILNFSPVTVLLLICVAEVYSWWCERHQEREWSNIRRIGLGILFAALSSAVTGVLLSVADLQSMRWDDISLFWQVPQYVFIGFADMLIFTAGYEFCYCESPPGIEGFLTGLFLGVGSIFGIIISMALTPLRTTDLRNHVDMTQLEILFFILSGLMLFVWCLYIILAQLYRHARNNLPDAPGERSISHSNPWEENSFTPDVFDIRTSFTE
ncbi:solute carrier family 15 member 4-like [Lineus longissimus]|uniref:solute carrier family 15 member 4-like n=1 Tax=Lineus longissimus TaxID=88925 RepID=UPI002B4DBF60